MSTHHIAQDLWCLRIRLRGWQLHCRKSRGIELSGTMSGQSGYFAVAERDGIFWLIDPTGRRLLSKGVNAVRFDQDRIQGSDRIPYAEACKRKYGNQNAWRAPSATLRPTRSRFAFSRRLSPRFALPSATNAWGFGMFRQRPSQNAAVRCRSSSLMRSPSLSSTTSPLGRLGPTRCGGNLLIPVCRRVGRGFNTRDLKRPGSQLEVLTSSEGH